MAYEPYEWKPKDNITTTRLNHIEQGIASGGGGVVMSSVMPDSIDDEWRLPMTWQDIRDAMASGKQVFLLTTDGTNREFIDTVVEVSYDSGTYIVRLFGGTQLELFEASSPSDYPLYSDGK